MSLRGSSDFLDNWSWMKAPSSFMNLVKGQGVSDLEDSCLVAQGRYEWFTCANEGSVDVRGDNVVSNWDVVRGRRVREADGSVSKRSRIIRDEMVVCRLIVHGSGLFQVYDISPMKDYDVSLCPRLPPFVEHRLDIAYSRYLEDLSWDKDVPRSDSTPNPPGYFHSLAALGPEVTKEPNFPKMGVIGVAPGCVPNSLALARCGHTLSETVRECEDNRRTSAVTASCRKICDVGGIVNAAIRAAEASVACGGSTVATIAFPAGDDSSCSSEPLFSDGEIEEPSRVRRRVEVVDDSSHDSSGGKRKASCFTKV